MIGEPPRPSSAPPAPAPPPALDCPDGACLTCSDAAVAMTVLRLLDDGFAEVDTGSGLAQVSVALVTAGVGDTVLVHAGEAIAVVERPEP